MNYSYFTFSKGVNYGFKKSMNFSFSSKFYKNSFKNKSVFNCFSSTSNINQGKFLINFSNKFFMDRVNFLANNPSTSSGGFGQRLLSGSDKASTDVEQAGQELSASNFTSPVSELITLLLARFGKIFNLK
jgi:hypothetical protein